MKRTSGISNHPLLDDDVPSAPTLDDFDLDEGVKPISVRNVRECSESFSSDNTQSADVESSAPPLAEETSFDKPDPDINICGLSLSKEVPASFDMCRSQLSQVAPYQGLQTDLQNMNPHQILRPELEILAAEEVSQVAQEGRESANSDKHIVEEVTIVPFTESQLNALYRNTELEKNIEFVEHWLDTQKEIEKFPLDEMLVNYLRVRTNLQNSKKSYDIGKAKAEDLFQDLWQISSGKVEEEGECEDGNVVTVTKNVKIAEFDTNVSHMLRSQLKECKEILAENHSLFTFRAEVLRLKIEEFLQSVVARNKGELVERVLVYSSEQELRLSVSVLFKFLRKDLSDSQLSEDLMGWLDRLVAVILAQPATLYDHLFILNHIMRCPAGVGKWAAKYIQPALPITDLEETSFDNPFLDHMITMMATILLPVKERENFLHEHRLRFTKTSDGGIEDEEDNDKVWTVLDGEGSEDEDPTEVWAQLRESDLIALFNQIPVDHMFRYVLRVEERDGEDQYDVRNSSQHSFLKLYAFASQFVYLLREGLRTFNTPRYRQFAKRIGRLIRHTVHYVSNHWEGFKTENSGVLDHSMMMRLQVQ